VVHTEADRIGPVDAAPRNPFGRRQSPADRPVCSQWNGARHGRVGCAHSLPSLVDRGFCGRSPASARRIAPACLRGEECSAPAGAGRAHVLVRDQERGAGSGRQIRRLSAVCGGRRSAEEIQRRARCPSSTEASAPTRLLERILPTFASRSCARLPVGAWCGRSFGGFRRPAPTREIVPGRTRA
jgi:hypothetical protein